MWVLILTTGLLVLLFGLLLMSLELEINTRNDIYEVRLGKITRANLVITEGGEIGLNYKFFWKTRFLPLYPEAHFPQKKTPKSPPKKKKITVKHILQRILSVIKSFRVRRLHADIDAEDYVLNAYLFPLFFMIKTQTGKDIKINFSGRNEADILIKNNLLRMGLAFLRYK
ncbi:MAG: hypothetical protein SF052_04585 [Bacteroidia bacterium]|nr:hypothetical protein [Bacteroidia bacterium]